MTIDFCLCATICEVQCKTHRTHELMHWGQIKRSESIQQGEVIKLVGCV